MRRDNFAKSQGRHHAKSDEALQCQRSQCVCKGKPCGRIRPPVGRSRSMRAISGLQCQMSMLANGGACGLAGPPWVDLSTTRADHSKLVLWCEQFRSQCMRKVLHGVSSTRKPHYRSLLELQCRCKGKPCWQIRRSVGRSRSVRVESCASTTRHYRWLGKGQSVGQEATGEMRRLLELFRSRCGVVAGGRQRYE